MKLGTPALYPGYLTHIRRTGPTHSFTQPVLMCLLELDELDGVCRQCRLFSHNRFNLFSFSERDHGPRDGSALAEWARELLQRAGITDSGGPLCLFTQPRMLNYVFNPLSVWFCQGSRGTLRALIYQVHNTYGEAHAYVIPVSGNCGRYQHSASKAFRVSPFLPMAADYDFDLRLSDETVHLKIGVNDIGGTRLFEADLRCRRRPFTDRSLLRSFLARPLSPQRAHLAIFRQAAAIWIKARTRARDRRRRSGRA